MTTRKLKLLKKEHREQRWMGLYQCICGVERWARLDKGVTRFRTCLCPTALYSAKTKVCTRCKVGKPVAEFFVDKRTGNPRPRCKTCHAEEVTARNRTNRERDREKNRKAAKRSHSRQRFRMEPEEYDKTLASFGDRCGICGQPETRAGRKGLCLDHCHKTGRIRGALCSRCNSMLGFAHDDPELLERATNYLRASL